MRKKISTTPPKEKFITRLCHLLAGAGWTILIERIYITLRYFVFNFLTESLNHLYVNLKYDSTFISLSVSYGFPRACFFFVKGHQIQSQKIKIAKLRNWNHLKLNSVAGCFFRHIFVLHNIAHTRTVIVKFSFSLKCLEKQITEARVSLIELSMECDYHMDACITLMRSITSILPTCWYLDNAYYLAGFLRHWSEVFPPWLETSVASLRSAVSKYYINL